MKRTAAVLIFIFSAAMAGLASLNEYVSENYVSQKLLPPRYSKNEHSAQSVEIKNGQYHYKYTFRDSDYNDRTWSWSFPKDTADKMENRFGIGGWVFDGYSITYYTEEERLRKLNAWAEKKGKELKKGLYHERGNYIVPDPNALVNYFMAYSAPIYNIFNRERLDEGMSRREGYELLMRFCQDIPYGVPPSTFNGKEISGLYTPPTMFRLKYGDCDSKAILYTSILAHDPKANIALISTPGHSFLGIEEVKRPYDSTVSYAGRTYVLLEPVGPGHLDFGEIRSSYSITRIEPFEIDRSSVASSVESPAETKPVVSDTNSEGSSKKGGKAKDEFAEAISAYTFSGGNILQTSSKEWVLTVKGKKYYFEEYSRTGSHIGMRQLGGKEFMFLAVPVNSGHIKYYDNTSGAWENYASAVKKK